MKTKDRVRSVSQPRADDETADLAGLRRQLVSARAALAEAEESGRVKDRLLSHAAHELRTPLASMMVWIGVLRQGRSGDVPAAMGAIEESARSQARLIEELVDISRALGGRLQVDIRPLDPRGPVCAAMAGVRPDAEARGVSLVGPEGDGVGFVRGDARRIEQIVSQLLLNAVKHTPAGGEIELRMSRGPDGREVCIQVNDRGQEFDPEMLAHLFFSVPPPRPGARTRPVHHRGGGRGFGLALVEQLVRLQGGMVSADSLGRGQGTAFTVHLPAAPGPAPAPKAGGRTRA